MNLHERKLHIISNLLNIKSEDIINQIESIIEKSPNTDWWETLSSSEKEALKEGINDLDSGNTISNDDVTANINDLLNS